MARIISTLSTLSPGLALAAASMMRMQMQQREPLVIDESTPIRRPVSPSVNIWARYSGGPQPTGKADKWGQAKRKQKAKGKAAHKSRMAQKRKKG